VLFSLLVPAPVARLRAGVIGDQDAGDDQRPASENGDRRAARRRSSAPSRTALTGTRLMNAAERVAPISLHGRGVPGKGDRGAADAEEDDRTASRARSTGVELRTASPAGALRNGQHRPAGEAGAKGHGER
jgi:hypothetical protein